MSASGPRHLLAANLLHLVPASVIVGAQVPLILPLLHFEVADPQVLVPLGFDLALASTHVLLEVVPHVDLGCMVADVFTVLGQLDVHCARADERILADVEVAQARVVVGSIVELAQGPRRRLDVVADIVLSVAHGLRDVRLRLSEVLTVHLHLRVW